MVYQRLPFDLAKTTAVNLGSRKRRWNLARVIQLIEEVTFKQARVLGLRGFIQRAEEDVLRAGQSARDFFMYFALTNYYRQRRVKCDEQRNPNCARCDKGSYICEWQDNRLGRSRASDDRLSSATTRSASLATVLSDDDDISHRFFSEGIVASVASLFTDMAESFIGDLTKAQNVSTGVARFYYEFVLRASQSSQVIRKTLTALCGLYERAFAVSRNSSPGNHEHISRYSEAVTDLRTSRELAPDIFLIASILFANCEYFMGDLCSAVRHLRAGARILVEHQDFADQPLSLDLTETLGTIFSAFDHDSVNLECATPDSDYLDTIGEHQFDDLNQANDQLLQIYSHTFALQKVSQNHPGHISPAAHDFQRWSSSWRSRTTSLEHSLGTEQLPWLQLLHGQHTALNTVIGTMSSTSETFTRDHQLDELILHISNFLQTCSEILHDPDLSTHPYHENVGLILPLFLVTLRCTDAQICETALSLLARLRVMEGVLKSCCVYAVARSAVNARHAARLYSSTAVYSLDDALPVAEIRKVMAPILSTELDITFAFPHNTAFGQTESNAIVGGFCPHAISAAEQICSILEAGGFQGPISTQALEGCPGHEST